MDQKQNGEKSLVEVQQEFIRKESQVDAVHPRFKPEDPVAQAKYELENYFHCSQCTQYFAPTVLALQIHFKGDMVKHRPCGSCRYCEGDVFEYSLNNERRIYHNCPKPGR